MARAARQPARSALRHEWRRALGYYLPPFAYSDLQVLQAAIEGTGGLDQQKLADYMRGRTFHTPAGDITFGANSE